MRGKKIKTVLFIFIFCLLLLFIGVFFIKQYKDRKAVEQIYAQERLIREKEQESEALKEEQDSFYQKLADGYNVNILILGDSIGKSEGISDPAYAWDIGLVKKLESTYGVEVYLKNLSINYANCYSGYASLMSLDDNKEYDLALLCFSESEVQKGFLFYESILNELRKKYKKCSVISIMEHMDNIGDESWIKKLTEYYHGTVISLHDTFNQSTNYNNYISHEIYPNDLGYELYVKQIMESIEQLVRIRKGYVSEDINPINGDIKDYSHCIFINQRLLRKVADNKWALDIKDFNGTIGIVGEWPQGNTTYDIYLDYEWGFRNEINKHVNQWYNSYITYENVSAHKEILITFSGHNVTPYFKGVYLSSGSEILFNTDN